MAKNAEQFEQRPWGTFEILSDFLVDNKFGPDVVIKKITVKPTQRLSYQSHSGRYEFWLVVQGKGKVVLNDKEIEISAGSGTEVPVGTKHRIINTDLYQDLIFVEVSLGIFDENDITRFEDDYGRVH